MAQYPVPQFIDRDTKLAFFISFKQTLYLVAGGVLVFIFYHTLPGFIFFVLSTFVMIGAFALAFVKIDGIPLTSLLLGRIGFVTGKKSYTWKKKENPYPFQSSSVKKSDKMEEKEDSLSLGKGSKLKDKKSQIGF